MSDTALEKVFGLDELDRNGGVAVTADKTLDCLILYVNDGVVLLPVGEAVDFVLELVRCLAQLRPGARLS